MILGIELARAHLDLAPFYKYPILVFEEGTYFDFFGDKVFYYIDCVL